MRGPVVISTDSRGHRGVDTSPGAHGQRVAEPGLTPRHPDSVWTPGDDALTIR